MKNRFWNVITLGLVLLASAHAQDFGGDHAVKVRTILPFDVTDSSDKVHTCTLSDTKLSLSVYGELGKPAVEKIDGAPYATKAMSYEVSGESNSFAAFISIVKGDEMMPVSYLKPIADGAVDEVMGMKEDSPKLISRSSGFFGSVRAEKACVSFTSEGHEVVIDIFVAITPDGLININCLHEKGDSAAESEATAFLSAVKYDGAGYIEKK